MPDYWWNDPVPSHGNGLVRNPHPLAGTLAAATQIAQWQNPAPSIATMVMAIEDRCSVSLLLGAVQCVMLTLQSAQDKGTQPDWGHVREHLEHAFEWATSLSRHAVFADEGSPPNG